MKDNDWDQRIVSDPAIQGGEPVIRGTRIRVAVIIANLVDHTFDEIVDAYPQLSVADVRAALLYASHVLRPQRVA